MKGRKEYFYEELRTAIGLYLGAGTSVTAKSDADALMIIVEDHVEWYLDNSKDIPQQPSNADSTGPGVTIVDGEGLNISYDYGHALESDMLSGLGAEQRIELLEACIFALNTRLNSIDSRLDGPDLRSS